MEKKIIRNENYLEYRSKMSEILVAAVVSVGVRMQQE